MADGIDHDERVMALATAALERPEPMRAEFVESVCGGDGELVEEVNRCVLRISQLPNFQDLIAAVRTRMDSPVLDFEPGTLLGERFRILRLVGSGGMGKVYEANDETLDRRVAIKCARLGHHASLPPEARTAREVSHYNVCKVYDLHAVKTEAGEISFLSMEFIEGETLSARLKRKGRLKPEEAMPIARQICAGLEQAHRQGVIHGDLKVANVILAKAQDGGVRAVITDFGLARFAEPDGSKILSLHGGTLDYMAPELFLGDRATVASDVYALGVMLHVMLTGKAPERTGAGRAELVKKPLPSGPDSVTRTMVAPVVEADWGRAVAGLPRPWGQVLSKCLEPTSTKRFASVEKVAEALEPRRVMLKWLVAALLLLVFGLGYWQMRETDEGLPVRLVVLPFAGEASAKAELSAVATDIADRLAGARRNFLVVSAIEAQQNQVDTPEKARGVLGATHVLQTKVRGGVERMNVEAQLIDVEYGKTVRVLESNYQRGDAATLAKALIGTVTLGLNLKPRATQEPVADAAYPAYIQGFNIMRQDSRKVDEAIPLLEKAMALDVRSALPVAALATAQVQKFRNGDGAQWLDRAEVSVRRAAGINPDQVQVLIASGLVDQVKGRYEQAVQSFQRATELDPANPSGWRMLAEAYSLAGRDENAVQTYIRAIEAEPAAYQPHFFFGNYYLVRSQWTKAEELYRTVTKLAPGLSSGHMNLGLALKQQGRYRESEEALLQAMKLRPSARLMLNLGALYYEQGRFEEALQYFQRSASQGAPSAAMYRNLGDAYRQLKRGREATDAYRSARGLSEEEVTTNPRSASGRVRLALLSARLGDRQRASYELAQALSMDRVSAGVTADAVQTFEVLKQREKALELLRQAPKGLVAELNRVPDLIDLRSDLQFQQLILKP